MPLRYKDRVLRRLKSLDDGDTTIRRLADEFRIEPEDFESFHSAIAQMADKGEVLLDDQTVCLPPLGDEVTGTFRKNKRGFGFIIPLQPNAHGDVFVPADATLDALNGDTVVAEIVTERRRGANEKIGVIIDVLKRKQSAFTGELVRRGAQWLVWPDGGSFGTPIIVRDVGAKDAKPGDKVVIEILHYPEGDELAHGVITKVLGAAGEPDVETQAVIAAYDLPGEFPEACNQQARDASAQFEEDIEKAEKAGGFKEAGLEDREDLRDTFIFTIDPPDARDFDDAISLERIKHEDGRPGWKLGVHIADVSSFVTPGSPLDEEAARRGNSVYLPRKVIPMLPELLSNGVCSLQERVPRFCKSAFMRYDDQGKVTGRGYSSTIIHSAKRLTYLEAQALIDGDIEEAKKHAKTDAEYSEQLIKTVKDCNHLSKILNERRKRDGMIHLDLPEVELIYDDEGRVIDAEPEDSAWTHTLIEMFMVEANEAVATLFERLNIPVLRRAHPDPDPGGFEDLQKFVKAAGYSIPKEPDRHDLQTLLDATKGTPSAPAIHFAVLRTLTKAEYQPANIGHYALASRAYSHFTSPIRRYPDLTLHRALAAYLSRTENGQSGPKGSDDMRDFGKTMRGATGIPPIEELSGVASRCNATEERATGAERDLRNFLVMQLFVDKIGEVFDGVVTGVTNAGVFVRVNKYLVEGLIKASDLPTGRKGAGGGRWKIEQRTGALVEQSTGRSFRLGDLVKICVSQVNLSARQLELLIPDDEALKRAGVGKSLTLGGEGGGVGHVEGAGFKDSRTGSQRRSAKSKKRDKAKKDFRKERKDKGKRR